jgi:hypothetical protein
VVAIHLQTWPPQAILVSDCWLISKKSSPLKPLGQMNRNMVGSILGRSRNLYRTFLPSFDSFSQAVSEETIFFLEINQSETRIACGSHVC